LPPPKFEVVLRGSQRGVRFVEIVEPFAAAISPICGPVQAITFEFTDLRAGRADVGAAAGPNLLDPRGDAVVMVAVRGCAIRSGVFAAGR
jgi:hypothetical protein